MNIGRCVGRVPEVVGTLSCAAKEPARASTNTIGTKRPKRITTPRAVFSHGVFACLLYTSNSAGQIPPTNATITTDVLSYQLLVVIVALVGGIWPALFAAVLSGFTLDFLFIEPLYTVQIYQPHHLLALILLSLIHI